MRATALVLVTGLGLAGVAHADQPPPAEPAATAAEVAAPASNASTPPAPAAAAPAATAQSAAPAAQAPPPDAAEAKPDMDERRLYTAGYRPEMQNGARVWCRRELSLGSRLAAQKNCGTADSLAQAVQQNQRQIDDAQRKTGFYPKNTKTP